MSNVWCWLYEEFMTIAHFFEKCSDYCYDKWLDSL